ncbi:hypothetical protein PENTCL1PPCAC_7559 [Pristionchus entomophagus]|uniref:Transmembrane protein n=1 Tax=Pristionchus entomophagus TaxID=358040 RepID=A0AAV5SR88_9BILA|nr:hypothetical protein PENTCL1PPCAC_7559 [Pristionchus entomophagus]
MNCPCCRAERRCTVTMTVKDDDVIEAKIEPIKPQPSSRRRPPIPYDVNLIPLWPPTKDKMKRFYLSCCFFWKHDRIFELAVYMMMVCLISAMQDLVDGCWALSNQCCAGQLENILYSFVRCFISLILFFGHGWIFQNATRPSVMTRMCLLNLFILSVIWAVYKISNETRTDYAFHAFRSALPEITIIIAVLLMLSCRCDDAFLRMREEKKIEEDEGWMRRRIIAELRARAEGVYMPMLVSEGESRRLKKEYIRTQTPYNPINYL